MRFNPRIKLKLLTTLPFFWFQKKKISNQKFLNISYFILAFALLKTNMSLINTLLCIFITIILLDTLINFRDIFSLNKQILCTLPFSPLNLIKNYVFTAYMKISIVLFLGFIFKFTRLIDILIFISSLILFYILAVNIYFIFSFIKKIYACLLINLIFCVMFFILYIISGLNSIYTIITVILLICVSLIIYKKMSQHISFEKIVIKE